MFDSFTLPAILVSFVALLFSLSVHEASHATSAYLLGDDTAAQQGRMTLNPVPHIDPLGTVVFPLIGMFSGGMFFGWAKPTPVNPARFTRRMRMKTGHALVAVAGPASNVVLAVLFLVVVCLGIRYGVGGDAVRFRVFRAALSSNAPRALSDLSLSASQIALLALGGALVHINVLLAAFNIIPLGPLDGAAVVRGFVPDRNLYAYDRFQGHPYMWIALMILAFTGLLGFVLGPLMGILYAVLSPLAHVLLGA